MFSPHRPRRLQALLWEDGYEPPEEPDQCRNGLEYHALLRREKMRLVFLGASFLLLCACFLIFWCVHTYLPLFFSILLIFVTFRCFDLFFSRAEQIPLSIRAFVFLCTAKLLFWLLVPSSNSCTWGNVPQRSVNVTRRQNDWPGMPGQSEERKALW